MAYPELLAALKPPAASTTRPTSTTPAVSAWSPTSRGGRATDLVRRASPSSSGWPTGAPRGPRWPPGTGRASCIQVPHRLLAVASDAGFDAARPGRLRHRARLPAPGRRRRRQGPRQIGGVAEEEGLDGARLAGGPGRRRHPGRRRPGGPSPASSRSSWPGSTGQPCRPATTGWPSTGGPSCSASGSSTPWTGVYFPSLSAPDHRLQGHAHRPPARRVLPRALRRAARERPGAGALPLLHQHLPELAAGPPLPLSGPQRRDQHRWPATGTGCGPARPCCASELIPGDLARAFPSAPPGPATRPPSTRCSSCCTWGAAPAPLGADDDPRGLGEPRRPWTRPAGPSTATTPRSWSPGTARPPSPSPTGR